LGARAGMLGVAVGPAVVFVRIRIGLQDAIEGGCAQLAHRARGALHQAAGGPAQAGADVGILEVAALVLVAADLPDRIAAWPADAPVLGGLQPGPDAVRLLVAIGGVLAQDPAVVSVPELEALQAGQAVDVIAVVAGGAWPGGQAAEDVLGQHDAMFALAAADVGRLAARTLCRTGLDRLAGQIVIEAILVVCPQLTAVAVVGANLQHEALAAAVASQRAIGVTAGDAHRLGGIVVAGLAAGGAVFTVGPVQAAVGVRDAGLDGVVQAAARPYPRALVAAYTTSHTFSVSDA